MHQALGHAPFSHLQAPILESFLDRLMFRHRHGLNDVHVLLLTLCADHTFSSHFLIRFLLSLLFSFLPLAHGRTYILWRVERPSMKVMTAPGPGSALAVRKCPSLPRLRHWWRSAVVGLSCLDCIGSWDGLLPVLRGRLLCLDCSWIVPLRTLRWRRPWGFLVEIITPSSRRSRTTRRRRKIHLWCLIRCVERWRGRSHRTNGPAPAMIQARCLLGGKKACRLWGEGCGGVVSAVLSVDWCGFGVWCGIDLLVLAGRGGEGEGLVCAGWAGLRWCLRDVL